MVTRRTLLIALGLVLITVVAYWRVTTAGFVDFDDPGYVFQNDIVLQGLTLNNVKWAFVNVGKENNWHPLTWLSHMLDITLFGVNPLGHHLVNLALHICNTLLLFALWNRMTRAVWASAMVAALFAVHPLHVESVAWVAERKDMLSTFLGLLTLHAYLSYCRQVGFGRYALVFGLFALGLMAKPMLVTLPCVMLLLDFWPLRRFWKTEPVEPPQAPAPVQNDKGRKRRQRPQRAAKSRPKDRPEPVRQRSIGPIAPLVLEKLPLLALAIGSSTLTLMAQKAGGALAPLQGISVGYRIQNAIVGYGQYVFALFWPANLAVFYPHKIHYPASWVVSGGVSLILTTFLVVFLAIRGRYYPIVGWLWFLGTLVPVIGLVQVGDQAMADRYTYIPYIGLFVALVWGASELLASRPLGRKILAIMAGAILATCTVLTARQLTYWQNTQSLLERALAIAPDNPGAHTNLGAVAWESADKDTANAQKAEADKNSAEASRLREEARAKQDKAMEHWRQAIRINPRYADAYSNLGHAFGARGQKREAELCFRAAIEAIPRCTAAHVNLGFLLLNQGKDVEAEKEFLAALSYEPQNLTACRALATINIGRGKLDEAMKWYKIVLDVLPNDPEALNVFAVIQLRQGKADEAVSLLQRLVEMYPNHIDARTNLGAALFAQGHRAEAIAQWREVLRQKPDTVVTLQIMAWTLATYPDASLRNGAEAVVAAERLVKLTGATDATMLEVLSAAYAEVGRFPEAIAICQRILQVAIAQKKSQVAAKMESRIKLFQSGNAIRDAQNSPPANRGGP